MDQFVGKLSQWEYISGFVRILPLPIPVFPNLEICFVDYCWKYQNPQQSKDEKGKINTFSNSSQPDSLSKDIAWWVFVNLGEDL